MKITKKTTLLGGPKVLRIKTLHVYNDGYVADMTVANPGGAVGYKDGSDGGPERFQAKYYINDDPTPHSIEPFLTGDHFTANLEFGRKGDTIKFVIEIDPAKTEWKQQPAEKSAVIP